mmetsp:Transcript_213/g.556  ORF Transcript_213/g.556 Transcript_213/m.556 type:complete len:772 (+) Transcript_213:552-2867(+)
MAVVCPVDHRPMGPWVGRPPVVRRSGHELKVNDPLCAVAHCRADAVVAGVPAADHNDLLPIGVNHWWCRWVLLRVAPPLAPTRAYLATIKECLGIPGQEVHGKVNAAEISTRHCHVTGDCCPDSEQNGIELIQDHFGSGPHGQARVAHSLCDTADIPSGPCHKGDALGAHDVDAALHHIYLVCLHVGHTVHHQATNAVSTLVDRHTVAHLVQLVCSGQAGRTGADDGHGLAGAEGRGHGSHPAHLVGLVDDGELYGLDSHRVVDDAKHAGPLAGCWADAARELGEVVCRHQPPESLLPLPGPNQLVPLRDQVSQGAARAVREALVAKGRAAVHTPSGLGLDLLGVLLFQKFFEVPDSLSHAALRQLGAVVHGESRTALGHQVGLGNLRGPTALHDFAHIFDVGALRRTEFIVRRRGRRICSCPRPRGAVTRQWGQHVGEGAEGGSRSLIRGLLHCGHEVCREDAHELFGARRPTIKDAAGHSAACEALMCIQQLLQVRQISRVDGVFFVRVNSEQLCASHRDPFLEVGLRVPYPGNATAHARAEVLANLAKHYHAAPGHVLTAVVARTLDDGPGARVPHREALSAESTDQADSRGGSVEGSVADDDVLLRHEAGLDSTLGRVDNQAASTETLAKVVLGVALQFQQNTLHGEGSEGLAGGAVEFCMAGARGKLLSPALVELMGEQSANGPVGVSDAVELAFEGVAEAEGGRELHDQASVQQWLQNGEVFLAVHLPALDDPDLASVRQTVSRHQDGKEAQRVVLQRWVHAKHL